MSLTDRISKICEEKKIRQSDLVRMGFGSKQTVNAVLNGKQNPSYHFIELLLKANQDIDARWLMTGDEKDQFIVEDSRAEYGYCKECLKKEGVIEHLKKEVTAKDKRILELEIKIAGMDGHTESQAGKKSKAS